MESAAQRLVNVHQAKTHLSQLLQQVELGEEVVIARSGVPIARLVAWTPPSKPLAEPGAMRGQIELADDFDAPLDDLFEALQAGEIPAAVFPAETLISQEMESEGPP